MSAHNENAMDLSNVNAASPATTVAASDDLGDKNKLIQVDFAGTVKRFSFKNSRRLLNQLKHSFGVENARSIELIEKSTSAVVSLGDLDDQGEYELKVTGHSLGSLESFSTQCPVHRLITLPEICRYVVDTPYFQRLRNESQLGAAGYVFMGATHTRFEHSIGAAYLAKKLVDQLSSNQPEYGITEEDRLCVIIAGLCHDLGHGPYSHVWDSHVNPALGIHKGHEVMSVKMIDIVVEHLLKTADSPMINAIFTEENVNFIKACIEPPAQLHDPDFGEDRRAAFFRSIGRPPSKFFLLEVVANKKCGVDVDKLDYILRDCHYTGYSSTVDTSRLISTARVMPCDNDVNRICWPAKAVGSIIDLFQRRASLHHDVYQHPTVIGVDLILRDVFVKASPHLEVRCQDGEFRSLKEASEDPVAFSRVTNWLHQFIQHGRHVRLNVDWNHPDMVEATRLLENISNRELFKIAGTFTERHPGIRDLTKAAEEIAALTGGQVGPDEIECRSRKISWGMKDKNPMENIRFYAEKGTAITDFYLRPLQDR
ncbi:SAM domain and HD [Perkinsus chesapeaki]|uniref:SAM domain and HD n=1 Tax=Perkinsus chesapeaki TaxID=330153 RepID=A0A7J6LM66_PERCH|nr:SAM domain and HD [Perkinsus chesapeaki]